MTDPTLTPEIYGDFGLYLAQMRDRKPDTSNVTVVSGLPMEERLKHVAAAREVLSRPDIHTKLVLREAAQVLRAWGDFTDQIMCDAVIYQIDKQEWDEIDRRLTDVFTEAEQAMEQQARVVRLAVSVAMGCGFLALVLMVVLWRSL